MAPRSTFKSIAIELSGGYCLSALATGIWLCLWFCGYRYPTAAGLPVLILIPPLTGTLGIALANRLLLGGRGFILLRNWALASLFAVACWVVCLVVLSGFWLGGFSLGAAVLSVLAWAVSIAFACLVWHAASC
jgi:hypothetical protein